MNIKSKLLVILTILVTLALSDKNNVYSQGTQPQEPEYFGVGDYLENLDVMIDYPDLQNLRFKNFEYELEKDRTKCVRFVVRYLDFANKYYFDTYLIPDCYNIIFLEYVYAPIEIMGIGPDYSESIQYFVQAVEESFSTDPLGKPNNELLRLGLLNFLAVHFPNNPMYKEQLPEPTAAATLTPTPTLVPTDTPTPTVTLTPTATQTLVPTNTPEPTPTPVPTNTPAPVVIVEPQTPVTGLPEWLSQLFSSPFVEWLLGLFALLIFVGIILLIVLNQRRPPAEPRVQ